MSLLLLSAFGRGISQAFRCAFNDYAVLFALVHIDLFALVNFIHPAHFLQPHVAGMLGIDVLGKVLRPLWQKHFVI